MHYTKPALVAITMLAARATLAAPAAYEVPEPVSRVAKAQITPAALRAPIRILASDEFEGRGPATRGDALARLYLSTELETLGYQPGGANGSWEQPFDIVGIKAKLPATWDFTAKGGSKVSLRLSDDYVAGSGVQTPTAAINDAQLVFVGYGIEAPEYKWDDFKGVDVRGKVLVMLNNDPDWDPALKPRTGRAQRQDQPPPVPCDHQGAQARRTAGRLVGGVVPPGHAAGKEAEPQGAEQDWPEGGRDAIGSSNPRGAERHRAQGCQDPFGPSNSRRAKRHRPQGGTHAPAAPIGLTNARLRLRRECNCRPQLLY